MARKPQRNSEAFLLRNLDLLQGVVLPGDVRRVWARRQLSRRDVVFDTSTAADLFDDEEQMNRLRRLIARTKLRFVVPMLVLEEMLDVEPVARRRVRLRRIGDLWRETGGYRFCVAANGNDIIRAEFDGPLHKTPINPNQEQRETLLHLLGSDGGVDSLFAQTAISRKKTRDAKNSFADDDTHLPEHLDRLHRELGVVKDYTDQDIFNAVLSAGQPPDDFYLLPVAEKILGDAPPPISSWWDRKVRYKSLRSYFTAEQLQIWASSIDKRGSGPFAGHSALKAFRYKRGDRHDNQIAASAAYARYFIVEETNFRERWNALVQHGTSDVICLRFEDLCSLYPDPALITTPTQRRAA